MSLVSLLILLDLLNRPSRSNKNLCFFLPFFVAQDTFFCRNCSVVVLVLVSYHAKILVLAKKLYFLFGARLPGRI